MSDFSFLKKYVLPSEKVQAPPEYKHKFYPLDISEVEEAEKRLNRTFPKELREFYLQIGYGFMCFHQKTFDNLIMGPHSIADLILGVGRLLSGGRDRRGSTFVPVFFLG